MLKILEPSQCCGCSACVNICSKHAIEMKPNALGFLYPFVDESKCVKCGLCEKVCSFNDNYDKSENLEKSVAYGVRHKNMSELETSRSGAAFIAVSDAILEQGGVVYGAGYTDHFRVVHKRAETKENRDEFKGSKYVQSELGSIFTDVKNDLQNGRFVLFSGTACQVAGLKSYLKLTAKKHLDNLFTIDIVCHGVPSPYIWRDYINYLEQKHNKVITRVNFRDKIKYGWKAHVESYSFGNEVSYEDDYTYLFSQHIMLRTSCGICHFTNLNRPGDITIGDFWGWEKVDSSFNEDNKGVSLVLCNSDKGKNLFDKIKASVIYKKAELEKCVQLNLQKPTPLNRKTNDFEKDYSKHGFGYVLKKYGKNGWRNRIRRLYLVRIILKIKNKVLH